jgi:hypothetical protein
MVVGLVGWMVGWSVDWLFTLLTIDPPLQKNIKIIIFKTY